MKKVMVSMLSMFLLASCSSVSSNEDSRSPILEVSGIMNLSRMAKVTDCLEAKNYEYSKILSQEDILKYYKVNFSRTKSSCGETEGEYGSCIYTWKSGRPNLILEISGSIIKVPDDNSLGIKMLSFYYGSKEEIVSKFDMSYKDLSKKEVDVISTNLEESYTNHEKLEEARSFMEIREENNKYELIEDLGSRAYWKWGNKYGGELVVLTGEASFTIVTKISEDRGENLELAKQLAGEVIGNCE